MTDTAQKVSHHDALAFAVQKYEHELNAYADRGTARRRTLRAVREKYGNDAAEHVGGIIKPSNSNTEQEGDDDEQANHQTDQ